MSGLLGIWNNANQKFLHDYEDWYNNEHLIERLSVSNINVARRFQGLKSNYNYFTSSIRIFFYFRVNLLS